MKRYKYAWYLSGLLLLFIIYTTLETHSDNPNMEDSTKESETLSKDSEKEMMRETNNDIIRVRLTFEEGEIIAILYDNEITENFLKLLPMDVNLEDYVGKEKIMRLPESITDGRSNDGYNPQVGDVACYSPWGNLVLFYEDQPYAQGLYMMGKIESGFDQVASIKDKTEVRIEQI